MPTNAECADRIREIHGRVDGCAPRWIFKWATGGVGGVLILIIIAMYSISCTARDNSSLHTSHTLVHTLEFKLMMKEISALKSELSKLSSRMDTMNERLLNADFMSTPMATESEASP